MAVPVVEGREEEEEGEVAALSPLYLALLDTCRVLRALLRRETSSPPRPSPRPLPRPRQTRRLSLPDTRMTEISGGFS